MSKVLGRIDCIKRYASILEKADKKGKRAGIAARRRLAKQELFYLLVYVLGRKDANRDWLYDRCVEVQTNPDGFLDLWAREYYKSTIITFALTIQDILKDPDITVGIFSHTRGIAKGFLRQIKREFEGNETLKMLFSDVLYDNPQRKSPKWSEDDGLVVKRKSNPKEATIESWGLVDGQPTSKHYKLMVYDDVVTKESVTTPDMINKVTDAWALSRNLGASSGKVRYIGTRYHFNDTYKTILERGAAIPRIYTATDDGTPTGAPVFLSRKELETKRAEQGPYIFSCQMLQNPVADDVQGFDTGWLKFWEPNTNDMNLYMICDPANSKKASADYTTIFVVGLGSDQNYYIVDMFRDRVNLTGRTNAIMAWHRKYRPLKVGYERYGKDSDIQHIEYVQEQENYRFTIDELGGRTAKVDRIRKLIPLFEQGRVYLPHTCMRKNCEDKIEDLTKAFINDEYKAFPVLIHDDMLDCLARILDDDLNAVFPKPEQYDIRVNVMREQFIERKDCAYI